MVTCELVASLKGPISMTLKYDDAEQRRSLVVQKSLRVLSPSFTTMQIGLGCGELPAGMLLWSFWERILDVPVEADSLRWSMMEVSCGVDA